MNSFLVNTKINAYRLNVAPYGLAIQLAFLFLFIIGVGSGAYGQVCPPPGTPIGSVKVTAVVKSLQTGAGMDDYENYDRTPGYEKPDLYYFVDYFNIKSKSAQATGGNYAKFYENQISETYHLVNHTLLNKKSIDICSFNGNFDLNDPNSLTADLRVSANEDDRGFQELYYGDDDYGYAGTLVVPFSYMADNGNEPGLYTRSLSGTTASGTTIPFPYYFTFNTSYEIDALQPHLEYLDGSNGIRSEFCEGEPIKIRVNYKWPFTNGRFEWQRKIGTGNWQTLYSYTSKTVIDDVARFEPTQYRVRLRANWNTYGADNYNGLAKAVSNPSAPLVVRSNISSFTYDLVSSCAPGELGKIRITGIPDAQEGDNLTVVWSDTDALEEDFININNYTADYLTVNDVSFSPPIGNWKIQIKNQGPALKCSKTYNFSIYESNYPEYELMARDPYCYGQSGAVNFNNIRANTPSGPWNYTLQAISETNDTISTVASDRFGEITLPVGKYMTRVVNSHGCAIGHPDTATIIEKPVLEATFADIPTYKLNGNNYHGQCANDKFSVPITINGGSPPYGILRIGQGLPATDQFFNTPPGENSTIVSGIGHGTTSFNIVDQYNCPLPPVSIIINNPPPVTFANLVVQDPSQGCGSYTNDGVISADPAGGIAPYTLYYNNAIVPEIDYTGLGNTVSSIKIVDDQGCQAEKTVSVENPLILKLNDHDEILNKKIPCSGEKDILLYADQGSVGNFVFTVNGVNCDDDPDCDRISFYSDYDPYGGAVFIYYAVYRITVKSDEIQTYTLTENGCTLTAQYLFEFAEPPAVIDYLVKPPTCVSDPYETTFYLENLTADSGDNYGDVGYRLDGVDGSVPLDKDTLGNPLEPFQVTLPIFGGMASNEFRLLENENCGIDDPFNFSLAPIEVFQLTIDELKNTECWNDETGSIDFSLTTVPPYSIKLFLYDSGMMEFIQKDSMVLSSNSHTFANLDNGDYRLEVSNANGCAISPELFTITSPNQISALATTFSEINCSGENGIIEVSNVMGGVGPYTYALEGKAYQANTMLDQAKSENNIIIKDANGCFAELSLNIPLAGPTLFSNLTQINPATECATGSAEITVQAGYTEPISIEKIADPINYVSPELEQLGSIVSPTLHTATIENLEAGKHYFLIKDGLGCELVDSISITQNAPLMANLINKTAETCYQQSSDATITVNAINGLTPYTISLNGQPEISMNNPHTFTNLEYGIYSFVIKDASGCITNVQDSIVAGNLPMATYTLGNYTGCSGIDLSAEVVLSGYNGTAPYTYAWEDGTTTNPKIGAARQEYHVTVTDANGCFNQETVMVTTVDSLVLSENAVQDVSCQADTDGTISVSAVGGFPPYQFSADAGMTFQADSTLTGFGIGTYEILVEDAHGCQNVVSSTINYTNALTASVNKSDVACAAANDGILTITIIGGVAPFSYSLDGINFQPQNTFTNLSPGNYPAWVEDGSGCRAVYTDNIITEPFPISINTNLIADESCGQMNGSVVGMASGGTPPLVYEWDGNPAWNTPTLTNVAAGPHTLKITDANLCTTSSVVMVNNLGAPTLSWASGQDEICGNNNGSITLNVTNGTGLLNYSWSHDAGLNNLSANNLAAGVYTCTVTDANNCTDVFDSTIDEIAGPALSLASAQNSLCSNDNGTIEFVNTTGTAPFIYTWSHDAALNANMASGLAAGSYSVTITDVNGCSSEAQQTIEYLVGPAISNSTVVDEKCEGQDGSIVLSTMNGTAPLSFSWAHDVTLNNSTAINLTGGSYEVTVTDALGCTVELTNITVGNSPAPELSIASFVNADCLNPEGAISVGVNSGTGPFDYAWSHDTNQAGATALGLTSGAYSITVTDANGCSDEVEQSLISFVGNSEITNSLDCFGDTDASIALTLEGNLNDYIYEWSDAGLPNAPMVNNLSAGEYSVTVTNTNGCTEVFTEAVNDPAEIIINITDVIPVGCAGNLGSASAMPDGGTGDYTYAWNDAANQTTAIAENLSIGNYEVLISDVNGCSMTSNIEILQSPAIVLTEGAIVNLACAGDQNGSVEVLAANGFGGYIYEWNTSDTEPALSNLNGGQYSVTVTDEVGCTADLSINLAEPDALESSILIDQEVLCNGDANGVASINVEGGTGNYSYTWNDVNNQSTATADLLIAGDYTVEVSDANGCTIINEISLTEPEILAISAEVISGDCSESPNGVIEVVANGGNGNYEYTWSNGATTATINELATGDYTFTIVDREGCFLIENFIIENNTVEFINLGAADSLVCNGDLVNYDFSASDFDTFSWSSGSGEVVSESADFTIFDPGTYYLSASNAAGCQVQDTISISQTSGNLDAFFIAPTDIVMGDTLVAVELTLPIPDEVSWTYDANQVTFIGQEGNQFFFSFGEAGEFDLQLNARLGSCQNQITKTIFVYETAEEIPFVNPLVPSILNYTVYPNPSDGRFQIQVELSERMEVVIDLYDSQSVLVDRSRFSGDSEYVQAYNLSLGRGVYYGVLQVAGERRTVTVVVE